MGKLFRKRAGNFLNLTILGSRYLWPAPEVRIQGKNQLAPGRREGRLDVPPRPRQRAARPDTPRPHTAAWRPETRDDHRPRHFTPVYYARGLP
jgi:hypothetical protein